LSGKLFDLTDEDIETLINALQHYEYRLVYWKSDPETVSRFSPQMQAYADQQIASTRQLIRILSGPGRSYGKFGSVFIRTLRAALEQYREDLSKLRQEAIKGFDTEDIEKRTARAVALLGSEFLTPEPG